MLSPRETDFLISGGTSSCDDHDGCFEEQPLVQQASRRGPRQCACRQRTLAVWFVVLTVIVVLKRDVLEPCFASVGALHGQSLFVSFAESKREGLLQLSDRRHRAEGSGDALAQWLAVSSAVGEAISGSGQENVEVHAAVGQAIQQAMGSGSKQEVDDMVKKALGRAVDRWKEKRRKLKHFIGQQGRPRVPMLGRTPAEKASVASCVFDTLQATTQLAALAANIKDAASTCVNVQNNGDHTVRNNWASKTCALNVESVFYSVGAIASALSVAASDCADTFSPDLNGLCAGSITTIIQTLMQITVSAELIAGACGKHVNDQQMPGMTIANLGSIPGVRRLDDKNVTEHAEHFRRLLIGGGKGSDATFCVVDTTSIAWYLAEAGLAINSAVNSNAGASCKPHASKLWFQSREQQAFCAVDVAGAIYGFLQAIYFILWSVAHCTDQLHAQALCGAGIDGILSSLSAIAYSGSAMWLACEELRTKWPKPPLMKEELDDRIIGNAGIGGRRLEEGRLSGAALAPRHGFATPEDAWKSIGFDLHDPTAAFRKARPRGPAAQEVISLVEQRLVNQKTPSASSLLRDAVCS